MSYAIVSGSVSVSGGVPDAGASILTLPRVECVGSVGSVAKRIINTGREVRP